MDIASTVVVRDLEARDFAVVRELWASGLLGNTVNSQLAYPASLIEEETNFVNETLQQGDMSCSEALVNAYQSDPDKRSNFWVAVSQGDADEASCVVGCVGLRLGKFPVGDIGRFGVSSACRGAGVGAQLLSVLEEYARQHGYISVTATTVALNTPAVKSYQKAGYREVYRGRQDGKQGEPDFIRMQKGLSLEMKD